MVRFSAGYPVAQRISPLYSHGYLFRVKNQLVACSMLWMSTIEWHAGRPPSTVLPVTLAVR
jgi:hypothetical protein